MSAFHQKLVDPNATVNAKRTRLARLEGAVLAGRRGTLGNGLGLVSGSGSLELLADGLDGGSAGAGDGGRVTEVGVDAGKNLTVVGLYVLDDDLAGNGVLAVTAGTVELAEVDDSEAVNGDLTLSVVLDDLVGGGLSTSALDHGVTITLEGEGILADIDPPDILTPS